MEEEILNEMPTFLKHYYTMTKDFIESVYICQRKKLMNLLYQL